MFRRTIFAAALGLMMAGAGPASAKTDIDIIINLGYGGFYGTNISCRTGARIVERRFNYVSARDCTGRTYVYTGRRNGKWFIIRVSAVSGRITDITRWYR
jgi:hypothetical protein